MSCRSFLPGLVLAALLATTAAHAQETVDDARAQELYDNGVLLYDEGRYDEAIIAWQEAYKLSKRPLLFYNMANAAERLGEYQMAIDHLNHYRAYAASDEREALDRRIKNLERRYDEQTSGSPPAAGLPAPVDGAPQPIAPAPAVAATPGFSSGGPTPGFSSGGPTPGPQPAANLTASPAPIIPAPNGAAPMVPAPNGPAPGPLQPTPARRARAAPVLLFTAGGIGLAAGGTFAGLALASRSQAGDLCLASGPQTLCPRAAQAPIQRDQVFSLLADIGFAIGLSGTLGGSIAVMAGPRAADTTGGF